SGICSVLASGYLRGPTWNVNHLVHIQGWGDFQIGRIFAHADPHPLKQNEKAVIKEDTAPKVLVVADESRREPLQSEIVPDPMDAEQTWPDEFDIADDAKLKNEAGVRKVPKGTSSYQAAWIIDDNADSASDDDEDSADEEEEEDHVNEMEMDAATEMSEGEGRHIDESDDMMSEVDDGDEADDLDEVEKYRREREDAQFPDEVDTPINDLARIRFQKYRGLKSFRTSPWDAKENLPSDYARIFQFQNYKKTKKTVLSEIGDYDSTACVFSGQYVTLQIDRVPITLAQQWDPSAPLILYQLLPHEQRMSVLNFVIRKHPSCKVPIMSKQKLIFSVGFRKFEASPIFSQHTNGNKWNVICLRMRVALLLSSRQLLFLRHQSWYSVKAKQAKRKMSKKKSNPLQINKRSVVCRYMFFNREDIEWFKPVELYTPSGRRGHIKEALGTHGHMKCRFDQQLNAADSVMMSLYKRVPQVGRSGSKVTASQESEAMDD
ncbi:hypothetical protein OSTOST_18129, partial [Ostertagia ostertagi]